MTEQITRLARTARAGANLFDLEDFVARELNTVAAVDPTAPTLRAAIFNRC